MKVLHITEAPAAGLGRHVLDLAEAQAKSGMEVEVIHSLIRFDSNFELRKAACIREGLIRFYEIPMQMMPALSDFSVIRKLRQYINANGPFDIIHSHSTKAGMIGRLGVIGLSGVGARVYTPHAPLTMNKSRSDIFRRGVAIYERLLSHLGQVIAVSEEEALHLVEVIGVPENKITVIHNGVDLAEFTECASERLTVRHLHNIDEDAVCIGFVGRLSFQKNPEALIRIFARVHAATKTKVILAMAGNGTLREEVRTIARELNIDSSIRWIEGGFEGRKIMAAFDIYAMPSRYEGLPYVLLEALATGLPIVTTEVGGVSTLVKNEVNGWVVPVDDEAQFSERLIELVDDRLLRQSFGARSREIASLSSVEVMVKKTTDLYRNLLKQ